MRLAILAIAGLTAGACASSNSSSIAPPTSDALNPYPATHLALCTAMQLASKGELISARKTFLDDAHSPLHDLAGEVADIDRSVSARLLEAKQKVEADFTTLDADVASDLDQLITRVRAAIVTLDQTPPPSCN